MKLAPGERILKIVGHFMTTLGYERSFEFVELKNFKNMLIECGALEHMLVSDVDGLDVMSLRLLGSVCMVSGTPRADGTFVGGHQLNTPRYQKWAEPLVRAGLIYVEEVEALRGDLRHRATPTRLGRAYWTLVIRAQSVDVRNLTLRGFE